MIIVGIDEVGRGCWAGPLVAGAVILSQPIPGLRDSKKLSAKRRQALLAEISLFADAVGIGWVSAQEVDGLGLTEAVSVAMRRALLNITIPFDKVVIDGSINFLHEQKEVETIVKADDLIPSVSAASIAAKVARDTYMADQAKLYPAYGFDKHVGYGTAAHRQAIEQHGLTPLHRRSFKPIQIISNSFGEGMA